MLSIIFPKCDYKLDAQTVFGMLRFLTTMAVVSYDQTAYYLFSELLYAKMRCI